MSVRPNKPDNFGTVKKKIIFLMGIGFEWRCLVEHKNYFLIMSEGRRQRVRRGFCYCIEVPRTITKGQEKSFRILQKPAYRNMTHFA